MIRERIQMLEQAKRHIAKAIEELSLAFAAIDEGGDSTLFEPIDAASQSAEAARVLIEERIATLEESPES